MSVKNKLIIRIFSLLLALAAVFAAAIPAFAASDKYDLSNKDSDGTEVLDAVSLIEEHIGASVTATERAFLYSYSTLTLKYNSVINANNVAITYEDGTLTVTAREYVYAADNGKTLVWIPEKAVVDGAEFPFTKTENVYTVSLAADAALDASVVYRAATELLKDDFNSVLNLYYDTAKYACDVADYETKRAAYEAYLYEKRLYDDKKAEYDAYLKAYSDYENQLYVYDNYEKLKEQYAKDLEAYNAYLEELERLADSIKEYEDYELKLKQVKKQLSAFELVYVKMKNNRDVYGAVMGNAVTTVLGSVGQIIAELGGKYEMMVNTANDATKSLRGLMPEYKKCKTEQEKYIFYMVNYKKICESMLDLTWALDRLYYAPGVKTMMEAMKKHENYVILVAQLVLVSNALVDGSVTVDGVKYDENWTMDKRSCNNILDGIVYFEDDDTSKPLEGYPDAVKKPDIKEVEKPVYPQRPSSRPVAPEIVKNPGAAPTEISNPVYPDAKNASVREIYSSLGDSEKIDLIDKKTNGVITQRNDITVDKTVNLESIVYKKYNAEQIILEFDVASKGAETLSFIHTVETDKDSPVLYDGPIPDNYSNASGSYVFAGWRVEGTSEKVDLTLGFSEHTVLVPYYERKPKYYNVTWVVDGKEYVEKHAAGTVPEPSFVPVKEDDGDYWYKFKGWMRNGVETDVAEIYSDVTYEAKFIPRYLIPSGIGGGASVTKTESSVACDVSGFTNPIFDLSAVLPKTAGKQSLVLTNKNANSRIPEFDLKFSFTDVIKMHEANVVTVILSSSFGSDGASIELSFYNKDNSIVSDIDIRPELSVGHKYADVSNFVLLAGREYVNSKIEAEAISFKVKPSAKYTLKREYYVTVVNSEMCDLKVDKDFGGKGEKISLSVVANPGVSIVGIDVADDKGNPISLSSNGTFLLPDSDVVISVRAKYILYNVEFISGGAVISRQKLTYGAMPVLPLNPSVASDGNFNYTFTGWSPSVSAVTDNITYEAVFEKSVVTDNNSASQDNPLANIMKYVKLLLIAAAVLLSGGIALIVFVIVRKVRKKKRLNADGVTGKNAEAADQNSKKTQKDEKTKRKKVFGKAKNNEKKSEDGKR